jgi:hypothetical protein
MKMTIRTSKTLLHWNYFLALEQDLAHVGRYVEFAESNFKTYSIELAHLLLATCSEVDVVLKGLCKKLQPEARLKDINDYQLVVNRSLRNLASEHVWVDRQGLDLYPWQHWDKDVNMSPLTNPHWWGSYNDVKHQRSDYFKQANLSNVLNAMAGLLVVVYHYYKKEFMEEDDKYSNDKEVTSRLRPYAKLLRFQEGYYREYVRYD